MKTDMERKFEEFDKANPHVFAKLVEIAFQVKASGKKAFGIAAIFERLRWISEFETEGDIYKLNNNFRAFYVRKLMKEYSELEGFFQTRASVADREAA